MSDSSDVLIIGAGLAGLSAAITLQAAGRDVRIIESSDRPGGRVTSDVIDGFICRGLVAIILTGTTRATNALALAKLLLDFT